jgi:hypothetical protein
VEKINPFLHVDKKALSSIVKSLENRWGLTIVSFLPTQVQQELVSLQSQISNMANSFAQKDDIREGRKFIEIYPPEQFHCTHFTLTRSDPSGPVRKSDILKSNANLYDMYKAVARIASQTGPITVVLNQIAPTMDGLGIVLLGKCQDDVSAQNRIFLIGELNTSLAKSFALSSRSWDSDQTKFKYVHCSLGYLKAEPPQGYREFVSRIEKIKFEPIKFSLQSISLVHHRFRTLRFPQEGHVDFQLGDSSEISESEFRQKINVE